ncbi:short-chain alcohol dehydrogenase [Neobacillus bataviensis LMG 21833]|uniref:Short-chain alcohol dehydrogenase n=1 Tax=Neobacillus bataviensis LMG 21833 TaxID=1117379 RepID=K6CKK3_9BACI|nr:SDR family oxidoreductase [Neobacillus bataviensis]EKN71685.1 short-chain alcohol dehydrogenase [Neobacillus bataviensis LMG 21833]
MKTMIITGAGSGLGKELALLFSLKGYHLLLTGRTLEKLTAVKKEIETIGGKADILQLDIRNNKDVVNKVKELSRKYTIFGLVNNAGIGHFGAFTEVTEQQINEMIDTNILGTILMTKAILPMLEQNNDGQIINIISTAGLRGKVNEAVYVASKFAVRGFTESLQKEYEGSGIKFNAVYMGGMNTPFWDESDHIKDKSRLRSAKEIAEIIIGRLNQDSIIIENP